MAPKTEPLPGPARPQGSPDIPQVYLPADVSTSGHYIPHVYGAARVQFADRRRGLEETRRVAFLASISPTGRTLDWDSARPTEVMPEQLLSQPPVADAEYSALSPAATQVVTFTRWARAFDRWIARTQRVELLTKQDPSESVTLGPKRGGVSVELVAIAWELGAP
jgi:hypothetical protein